MAKLSADLTRVADDPWVQFLEGQNDAYPVTALLADLARVRADIAEVRADTCSPDTRLSDDMNHINPVKTETLTQLMLGGLPTGRVGSPLYCRVRYFDPVRQRAGIPEDVAALVQRMTADETVLTLVNVNQLEARIVIIQGGGYAEHQIESVTLDGETYPIDDVAFLVQIDPGAGATVTLKSSAWEPPRSGLPRLRVAVPVLRMV